MNLRRSANATMNKTLGRLERLAKSIVPLRNELYRETAKLVPLLPIAKRTQLTRLVRILAAEGEV